jgi:hypothetical protein
MLPASAVVPAEVKVSLAEGSTKEATGTISDHTFIVGLDAALQEAIKSFGTAYFCRPPPGTATTASPYRLSVLCKTADLRLHHPAFAARTTVSVHVGLSATVSSEDGRILEAVSSKGDYSDKVSSEGRFRLVVGTALERALTGVFGQAAAQIRTDLETRNKAPVTQQTAAKPKQVVTENGAEMQARVEAGKREWERLRPKVDEALARKDLKQAVVLLNQALAVGQPSEEAQRQLAAIGRSAEWVKVRPKVTVQKFDVGEGLAPSLGAFLYNALMSDLANSQQFTVVDWQEMDRVVSLIAKAQPNVSVEDQKRLAMNQLGISQMVLGSVYKVGEKYYLTVKTLGLDLGVLALHKKSVASEDEFEACITALARQMLQDASF